MKYRILKMFCAKPSIGTNVSRYNKSQLVFQKPKSNRVAKARHTAINAKQLVDSEPENTAPPALLTKASRTQEKDFKDTENLSSNLRNGDFEISVKELKNLLEANSEKLTPRTLENILNTDLKKGLSNSKKDLNRRKEIFGTNKLAPPQPVSFLRLASEALEDPTLLILIASGTLSLILQYSVSADNELGWLEGAAILASVLVVVMVTATTNYQKEIKFREISTINEDIKVRVIRGSIETEISRFDLVVGDLVVIEGGDILQSDIYLFEGSEMRVDESHLTGESDDIYKSPITSPLIYSGSKILEGHGKALVVAVGKNSKQGLIASLVIGQESMFSSTNLQTDASLRKSTVLTGKLEILAGDIGRFGVFAALFSFLAMSGQTTWDLFFVKHSPWDWSFLEIYLHQVITAITILVVAVPEGLPLASTLALAFSVQRMMQQNNLVRHLDACENMGAATTICCDKTGTLTSNDMNVRRLWSCDEIFEISDLSSQNSNNNNNNNNNNKSNIKYLCSYVRDTIAQSISINSTAAVSINSKTGVEEILGNRTECGLLKFVKDSLREDYNDIRNEVEKIEIFPFTSARKRMGALVRHKNSKVTFHIKGAAEIVLDLCTKKLTDNGEVVSLTPSEKLSILSSTSGGSDSGLRMLCIAIKDVDESNIESLLVNDLEKDLALVCVIGLSDTLRPEVVDAIQQCRRAGVQVKMLTGDNSKTASAIAQNCGIINGTNGDNVVLEGPEFRKLVINKNGDLDEKMFSETWRKFSVLARCSPEDKYIIVKGLQAFKQNNKREIVAMTGDGTNDAPALKIADIGFAMASGTPIARDASDILLLDDSLTSVVNALKWGRNIYSSVSKFLQFQLTVNVVAVATACAGAIWIKESPLAAVQMLWVNLIMDSFASLSLATELPSDSLLDTPPIDPEASILTPSLLQNIATQSLYQLCVMYLVVFHGRDIFDHDFDNIHLFSLTFNTFVWMQLFNQINSRKLFDNEGILEGLLENKLFCSIWTIECIVQYFLVQYGGAAFDTVPLSWKEWLICIGFGALSLPIREIKKHLKWN